MAHVSEAQIRTGLCGAIFYLSSSDFEAVIGLPALRSFPALHSLPTLNSLLPACEENARVKKKIRSVDL